jgi:hypothetical protein
MCRVEEVGGPEPDEPSRFGGERGAQLGWTSLTHMEYKERHHGPRLDANRIALKMVIVGYATTRGCSTQVKEHQLMATASGLLPLPGTSAHRDTGTGHERHSSSRYCGSTAKLGDFFFLRCITSTPFVFERLTDHQA